MTHRFEQHPLLSPALGTQRTLGVHRFGIAGARPKIYLQAALHADELPGAYVLHHLLGRLKTADGNGAIKGEIVVVPLANPIGLSQRIQAIHAGRSELGLGGNFNRNYPDLGPALRRQLEGRDLPSDPETLRAWMREEIAAITPRTELDSLKKLLLGLAIDADYVLDLHCDDEAIVYVYLSDKDHPAADVLARDLGAKAAIAGASDSRTFKDACARPWQTASHIVGKPLHGCLAATVEYRGTRDIDDPTAQEDAERLYAFMQRLGIVEGEPCALPPAQCPITPLAAVEHIQADASGVIVFHRRPGDLIAAGDIVADIVDPVSGGRRAMRARAGGILFGHVATRLAVPGSTIASLAGEVSADAVIADPYP